MDIEVNSLVNFIKPVGFFDYIQLQQMHSCILIVEQSKKVLFYPFCYYDEKHMTTRMYDEGTLIMSGLKSERIIESIEVVTKQHKKKLSNYKRL